jgi:hypothetical protein
VGLGGFHRFHSFRCFGMARLAIASVGFSAYPSVGHPASNTAIIAGQRWLAFSLIPYAIICGALVRAAG